jgi:hypothetical protein
MTPAFYNVYGQALHQHWYDIFEKYLMFIETLIVKHANAQNDSKEAILSDFKRALSLERQMAATLKLAVSKFKHALQLPHNMQLAGRADATEDDIELVEVCSKTNSIKAELMRTYLISLIFNHTRFDFDPKRTPWMHTHSKFQRAIKEGKIWSKNQFPEEVADMLSEEIVFILDWLQDLLAMSKRWNVILNQATITETDISEIKAADFEFDGDLQVLDNPDESTDESVLPEQLPDIDGSIDFYSKVSEIFSQLIS